MLTFEEKLAIIESFPQLERKNVSLKRVNFQLVESISDKKNVVYHLHPNGNGFIYAANLSAYQTDDKGMINIRDFSEDQLRTLLKESITSLSPVEENEKEIIEIPSVKQEYRWVNDENDVLILVEEDQLWNVYYGDNLDAAFESFVEAVEYLEEEGFRRL
ncbi:MAG: hypothetical protein Q8906_15285 [Bacillota bacterium]|nr:hypothetical protein [Bacillota bacterium]MDP4171971.1 hypothetical protein [Bacillota bacterium]